jgi:hypothetical protein
MEEHAMSPTTVPVTITPEAAARVAELGMQRELDLMLEHTKPSVPGLRRITLNIEPCYDTREEEGITIDADMDDPHLAYDPTEREWGRWMISTFPPEVCEHFALMTHYWAPDER